MSYATCMYRLHKSLAFCGSLGNKIPQIASLGGGQSKLHNKLAKYSPNKEKLDSSKAVARSTTNLSAATGS